MSEPTASLYEASKITRDGLTIFKRYLAPGKDFYYFKFTHRKKQYLRKLCATADESFTAARKILRAIRDNFGDVVDEILDATKTRGQSSTLGEIFTRYETNVRGHTGISKKTAAHNVNAIRNIIRITAALPAAANEEIAALPSSTFSAALLEKYKSKMLAGAGTDKLLEDRARVTANSTIRQARSLFAKKLPADFYKALVLPDVLALTAVKLLKESRDTFKMPAAELLKRIQEALPALKLADPNAYLIYLLGYGVGLRAGEIAHARQHWLEPRVRSHAGKTENITVIHVQTETDFRAKSKDGRIIPVGPDVLAQIRELVIPVVGNAPDYILRGNMTERCDQSFRRFSAWLKNLGWDRLKKCHELRKMLGSHVTNQAGTRAAQEILGHAQLSTTERYYVAPVDIPHYVIPALAS